MFVHQSFLCFSIVVVVVFGQGGLPDPPPGVSKLPPLEVTHTARFVVEIEAGGGFPSVTGTLTVGLFGQIVPKTVTNFILYAKGRVAGRMYMGRHFHRLIKGYIIQGGDLEGYNGTSGFTDLSIRIPSENFELKHVGAGWLSMANGGKDTNGSQFFITLSATHGLDGQNVVFGKVLSGMGMVRSMENVETDQSDKPVRNIIITDSSAEDLVPPFPTTLREAASDFL